MTGAPVRTPRRCASSASPGWRDGAEAFALSTPLRDLGRRDAVRRARRSCHSRLTQNTCRARRKPRACQRMSCGVVEHLQVMHGAHEAVDQAVRPAGWPARCRRSVVRVQHVEARGRCSRSARCAVKASMRVPTISTMSRGARADRNQARGAAHRAEELLARRGGRHHRHVVARVVQRMREFERVHHAAARVDRVGEQADLQRREAVGSGMGRPRRPRR